MPRKAKVTKIAENITVYQADNDDEVMKTQSGVHLDLTHPDFDKAKEILDKPNITVKKTKKKTIPIDAEPCLCLPDNKNEGEELIIKKAVKKAVESTQIKKELTVEEKHILEKHYVTHYQRLQFLTENIAMCKEWLRDTRSHLLLVKQIIGRRFEDVEKKLDSVFKLLGGDTIIDIQDLLEDCELEVMCIEDEGEEACAYLDNVRNAEIIHEAIEDKEFV